MPLPRARGPLGTALLRVLTGAADDASGLHAAVADLVAAPPPSWVDDDDVQLALLCLYELHYRGLEGVDDAWEWDVDLLTVRATLERLVEEELRARVPVPDCTDRSRTGVAARLFRLTEEDDSPSLARYVARRATQEQVREVLVHKSVYQLKEADPHTWAVPRLGGRAKAALVEIQADEYGGGDPERMHHALFASSMRGLGLDDTYGRYVDHVPASTLASVNAMSLFGLHRRLRGAIVGHLAAFEMTSSLPNRLYGNGLRRLGHDDEATTWYFDEHVAADAVHEQIAARDLAGNLAEEEPAVVDDVLWGAAACLALEGWAAAGTIERWEAGESSLRRPL
ncbi:iron-containing redox enzyme family protein [Cellulomonas shaoxiangyii]|uniref:Iron-containing redox enzyme family protein n=1 Tax=Cellulomonas shaoxiangyii TaxID=2566013 RepID=A0A4P7SNA0_9CELL|nr:iron-containing redox enzyme family protein [Cellulomonas shaoxiangyii]QCB95298.1 iron-containing redox enzyme family protein [Cellulomonas shaoxiangyii]TGY80118.1 iron-containing redox enzyme family protein [Cellulomonas shaoxiangyii]